MLSIQDGQCGMCAHFGNDQNNQTLVQIRVRGEAPEGYVDQCGLPENASRGLKVAPIGSCAGFQSAG